LVFESVDIVLEFSYCFIINDVFILSFLGLWYNLTMKSFNKKIRSVFGEIIFGLEDSLVSTLGAVTGIAAGSGNQYVVILSGIVLIFAEALSMTAGSYLSVKTEEELESGSKIRLHKNHKNPYKAAIAMGASYLFGGIFPLFPYFFFPIIIAIPISIVVTMFVLFFFGSLRAKFVKVVWWKSGLEMLVISISAAIIGFVIGRLVSIIFNIPVEL